MCHLVISYVILTFPSNLLDSYCGNVYLLMKFNFVATSMKSFFISSMVSWKSSPFDFLLISAGVVLIARTRWIQHWWMAGALLLFFFFHKIFVAVKDMEIFYFRVYLSEITSLDQLMWTKSVLISFVSFLISKVISLSLKNIIYIYRFNGISFYLSEI